MLPPVSLYERHDVGQVK